MSRRLLPLAALALLGASRLPEIRDGDTRAWWRATEELAGDDMEGRDTGSPAYDRAAALVARRFAAAGLKPAGVNGAWFQPLRFRDLTLDARASTMSVGGEPLRLLHDVTLRPSPGMPRRLDAGLAFRGYCAADAMGDVRGKLVLCYGWRRAGLTDAGTRLAAAERAGAAGVVTIADPGFTVEPMRWPVPYARTVMPADAAPPPGDRMLVATLNPDSLPRVLAGSGQDAGALLAAGSAGRPLPSFDLPGRFTASLVVDERQTRSANVLGLLPGTDPRLARQVIVLSAHLDGYGRGEPVRGDGLYNGALDDAAYVALLEQLAARRAGRGYRRPVLFAAFTGEEKGLLGATAFVAHPTVPRASLAADINLDQLRPLFPLDLLTVHALGDTTLGDAVRGTAAAMGIAVQLDPEPERGLLRRADHWPFLAGGVPATGFVFGYRPGTDSERRYRQWYETRYHKPQDDPGAADRLDGGGQVQTASSIGWSTPSPMPTRRPRGSRAARSAAELLRQQQRELGRQLAREKPDRAVARGHPPPRLTVQPHAPAGRLQRRRAARQQSGDRARQHVARSAGCKAGAAAEKVQHLALGRGDVRLRSLERDHRAKPRRHLASDPRGLRLDLVHLLAGQRGHLALVRRQHQSPPERGEQLGEIARARHRLRVEHHLGLLRGFTDQRAHQRLRDLLGRHARAEHQRVTPRHRMA